MSGSRSNEQQPYLKTFDQFTEHFSQFIDRSLPLFVLKDMSDIYSALNRDPEILFRLIGLAGNALEAQWISALRKEYDTKLADGGKDFAQGYLRAYIEMYILNVTEKIIYNKAFFETFYQPLCDFCLPPKQVSQPIKSLNVSSSNNNIPMSNPSPINDNLTDDVLAAQMEEAIQSTFHFLNDGVFSYSTLPISSSLPPEPSLNSESSSYYYSEQKMRELVLKNISPGRHDAHLKQLFTELKVNSLSKLFENLYNMIIEDLNHSTLYWLDDLKMYVTACYALAAKANVLVNGDKIAVAYQQLDNFSDSILAAIAQFSSKERRGEKYPRLAKFLENILKENKLPTRNINEYGLALEKVSFLIDTIKTCLQTQPDPDSRKKYIEESILHAIPADLNHKDPQIIYYNEVFFETDVRDFFMERFKRRAVINKIESELEEKKSDEELALAMSLSMTNAIPSTENVPSPSSNTNEINNMPKVSNHHAVLFGASTNEDDDEELAEAMRLSCLKSNQN